MKYLSTLSFPKPWLDELQRHAPGVEIAQLPADKPGDVPDEVWAEVDVLHTATVLPDPELAPRLRWVQLDTSGVDHVRDTGVWRSGIDITTIGGVSPVPLAQYVLFCVLGFAHRLPEMLAVRASGHWPTAGERWQRLMPVALEQATMVVVGYGRIGREIGRLARAHGMNVVGVTRSGARREPDTEHLVDFAVAAHDEAVTVVGPDALHDVLAAADYVVVVVPLTDDTRNLLDRTAIAAIKPGAVLVNVSRGGIVDESALRDALRSGALTGAALDVFDVEPLPPDSPWWCEPNVFATPHVSGLAPRYFEQVLQIVATNLHRFAAGQPLLNLVDRGRGY